MPDTKSQSPLPSDAYPPLSIAVLTWQVASHSIISIPTIQSLQEHSTQVDLINCLIQICTKLCEGRGAWLSNDWLRKCSFVHDNHQCLNNTPKQALAILVVETLKDANELHRVRLETIASTALAQEGTTSRASGEESGGDGGLPVRAR